MKPTSQIIIFILVILTAMTSAHAASPREELKQMVEQLQANPTDNALREKIIRLAQEVKPALAVPPEAKRAFVMGGTYQKEAKSPEDFGLAVKAYQDATTAAPWWGDAYYNLSVALESAKRYDEAKGALTLYLLTNPKDAEQAQERIYAIDAKKVLAAKQQQAEAAKPNFSGKWRQSKDTIVSYAYDGYSGKCVKSTIEITEDVPNQWRVRHGYDMDPSTEAANIMPDALISNTEINGRQLSFRVRHETGFKSTPWGYYDFSLRLADDGSQLAGERVYSMPGSRGGGYCPSSQRVVFTR